MFKNPRRGRQARHFTTNVPKILDLKSSSEQIFCRKLSLGAPDKVRFQDLIISPGIAVVKNRDVLADKARWNVIKEFSQIWTVIVLALLLNAIFGILIWVLVSRHVLFYEKDTSNFWPLATWIIMSRSFQTFRHRKIHSNVKNLSASTASDLCMIFFNVV